MNLINIFDTEKIISKLEVRCTKANVMHPCTNLMCIPTQVVPTKIRKVKIIKKINRTIGFLSFNKLLFTKTWKSKKKKLKLNNLVIFDCQVLVVHLFWTLACPEIYFYKFNYLWIIYFKRFFIADCNKLKI